MKESADQVNDLWALVAQYQDGSEFILCLPWQTAAPLVASYELQLKRKDMVRFMNGHLYCEDCRNLLKEHEEEKRHAEA